MSKYKRIRNLKSSSIFPFGFSEVLSDFLNCVPKVVGSSATPVRIAKLKCLRKVACSDLFKDPCELTSTCH